jgi:hypothetical protein
MKSSDSRSAIIDMEGLHLLLVVVNIMMFCKRTSVLNRLHQTLAAYKSRTSICNWTLPC